MPAKAISYLDRAILPLRVLFGGFLLYTAVVKALHPVEFLEAIRGYQILPTLLVPWSGFLLIALEAAIGIALLFGYFVRKAAMVAAALVFVFTAAIASAVIRQLPIVCGCGINGDAPVSWWEVARDLLLVAVAVLIAWRAPSEYPWFSPAKAEGASS
jgi:hypothetical protein